VVHAELAITDPELASGPVATRNRYGTGSPSGSVANPACNVGVVVATVASAAGVAPAGPAWLGACVHVTCNTGAEPSPYCTACSFV